MTMEQSGKSMSGRLLSFWTPVRAVLVLLVNLIWIVALLLKVMPYQIDDAYITYRYVDNFLHWGHISFNPGGEVVEGYTSQLWFWLIVMVAQLGNIADVALIGPALGIGSLLLGSMVLFHVLQKKEGALPALLACVLLLSLPSVPFYAVSGMEELLFSWLVLFVGLGFAGYWQGSRLRYVLIFATVWCRPEAPWLLVMLAMVMLYERRIRAWLPDILVLAMAMASLLAYRYWTFGDFLPNTFYAKEPVLAKGVQYFLDSVQKHGWFTLLLAISLLGGVLGHARHRLLLLFGVSWLLVAVLEGGDWMDLMRFFLPAMLLLVAAVPGVAAAGRRLWLYSLLLLPLAGYGHYAMQDFGILYQRYLNNQLMDTYARAWLDANKVKTIAAVDMGSLFYRKPYQAVDLVGLVSRDIAHMPGRYMSRKIEASYLLQRDVEVVLIRMANLPAADAAVTEAMFDNDTELFLFFDPEFLRNYELVMMLGYPDSAIATVFHGYMILARKDRMFTPDPLPVRPLKGFSFVDYTRPVSGYP